MNLPRYHYRADNNFLDYEFVSEGPKGKIRKAIRFTQLNDSFYNLGFGDMDKETGEVNDLVVTDNKDSNKVLATVVSAVFDFFNLYPYAYIFIQGSTPSRTRLYRIGIVNNWLEISISFNLYGFINGQWEGFQTQRNYEAFLIALKQT